MTVVEILCIKTTHHFRNTHISLPNLPSFIQVCWSFRWWVLIINLFQHQRSFTSFQKTFMSLILAVLGSWDLLVQLLACLGLGLEDLGILSMKKPVSVFIACETLGVVAPGNDGRREVFSDVGEFWTLVDQIKWHCVKSGCYYASSADYRLVVTWKFLLYRQADEFCVLLFWLDLKFGSVLVMQACKGIFYDYSIYIQMNGCNSLP